MRASVLLLVMPTSLAEPLSFTWYESTGCTGALLTDLSFGQPFGDFFPNPTLFADGGTCHTYGNDPDGLFASCSAGVVTFRQYKGAGGTTCTGDTGRAYWFEDPAIPSLFATPPTASDGDCVDVAATTPARSFRITCMGPPNAPPSPPPPPLSPPPATPPGGSIGGTIGAIVGGCFVPVLVCILWLSGAFGSKCPSPLKKKPTEKQMTNIEVVGSA